MLWQPTYDDRDEAFLQVQYGDMLSGLPVEELLDQIYSFERLVWFGRVIAEMERAAPSLRTMMGRNEKGTRGFPRIPPELWVRGAREADKSEQVTTRFIHYGSPLEIVLGASIAVGSVTWAFQRVLLLWDNVQSTRVAHMRNRLLSDYYYQVEAYGPDIFEKPEDYHRFLSNLSAADRGLQGITEIKGAQIPPLGAMH